MNSQAPDLPQLRSYLLEGDETPFIKLARKKKRVLSQLTALTYDSDSNVSLRAIQCSGLAAKIIAERDPEYIRNYLLRLFWLVNDESGGICWKAPELIGEILYSCPQFSQFFPMLISLLDLEKEDASRFRTGTLWAIGRVAQAARETMVPALEKVQRFTMWDQDTVTQKMAVWCVEQINAENI